MVETIGYLFYLRHILRADSDKVTVETIDDGEFASEEVEISFFEGLIATK